ncbi:hypothetical protein BD410DRAFT_735685, partial [Rickenella mellea]
MFHCAQSSTRQHKSKKFADESKQRDKESMHAFQCKGWLHITLSDLSDVAFIKLGHREAHTPYWPIDIPPDVEKYVRENAHLTPTQVSNSQFKKSFI